MGDETQWKDKLEEKLERDERVLNALYETLNRLTTTLENMAKKGPWWDNFAYGALGMFVFIFLIGLLLKNGN